MPRAVWPLRRGRPIIEVVLPAVPSPQPIGRILLADTGAGALHLPIDLILEEDDCLLGGGTPHKAIVLGGAYQGTFPTYVLRVQVAAIGFDRDVRVVGLPAVPTGFDGIACFRFLNRFTYGNFGDPGQFGLEA
jgi:hypothetical protein